MDDEVKLTIESWMIRPKPLPAINLTINLEEIMPLRKLKANWTREAAQDLRDQHNIDAERNLQFGRQEQQLEDDFFELLMGLPPTPKERGLLEEIALCQTNLTREVSGFLKYLESY